MAKKFLTGLQLLNLTSDPATGTEGELYYNTTDDVIKIYSNGSWSKVSSFSNILTSPSTQLITTDSNSDTLTFISGENISISADSSNDSITINSTGNYTSVDSIAYPDYISFDTTPETIPTAQGSIYWDSGDSGLRVISNATSVLLGQAEYALVKNNSGASIAKGKVVYISGAQGQRPTIALASANAELMSSKTFGIAAETIADGAEGIVITQGILRTIDTAAFTSGSAIYLSTTPGDFTHTKPQAPTHMVFLGYIVKSHASSGEIYVKIQNGYEIDELHNVRISGVANDDLLIYNSASSIWINSPIQNYLNTASAAAYASASAYTDSEINSLTTTDIEEGSNLYYTNTRGLTTASTALVHGNHTNLTATYTSNEIRFSATGGMSSSSGSAVPSASASIGSLYYRTNSTGTKIIQMYAYLNDEWIGFTGVEIWNDLLGANWSNIVPA